MSAGRTPAPLALTLGDPSGVGPELALKAWLARAPDDAPFFIVADPAHLRRVAQALGLAVPIAQTTPREAPSLFASALPVVSLGCTVEGAFGGAATDDGAMGDARATIASIEQAVELVARGEAGAVVTNPITKDSLYRAGFRHPGHTEFLGELASRFFGVDDVTPVMMLWCPDLAVVPVTIHVALRQAIAELSTDRVVRVCSIVAHDLRTMFGVARPRLAIAGLNPHAGENGAMGSEDRDIVAPAVRLLKAQGVDARGPLPADTLFHARARETYDAAVCMYHDQALIPIKTLAFDEGVNVTLGLPFVRTSPDHGTAHDIAGKGVARPDSLIAALRLAARLSERGKARA